MLINVELPLNSYNIRVGESIESLSSRIKDFSSRDRIIVITNKTLAALYIDRLNAVLARDFSDVSILEIEDGEEYKSLETADYLYSRLVELKIERYVPLMAFGGGVIGDLAGFVASTFLRGLPFINVPTSLLAQVDSSIGGKTGVNLSAGKNLVGTFYQPLYVHSDVELLKTLPKEEFISGMGEVIKHAVLQGSKFIDFLESSSEGIKNKNEEDLEIMISECARIKSFVVMQDEKESGLRKILNFGHTLGHAIETRAGYGNVKHGEAVALGMLFAASLADISGVSNESVYESLRSLIEAYELPVLLPVDISIESLIETMYLDKKVRDGKIEFVLPVGPGALESGQKVSEDHIRQAFKSISA